MAENINTNLMRYFDTCGILLDFFKQNDQQSDHLNVSAMNQHDLKAEIAKLEDQLNYHQKLLDQAFSDNIEFAETKGLFHNVKMLSDKLQKLKNAFISLSI